MIDKGIAELQTTASTYKWMVEERDKEIASLKTTRNELEEKVADRQGMIASMKQELISQADRIDALKEELNDQDLHIAKLEERIQELEPATPAAAAPSPIDPDEKKYLETMEEVIRAGE
jgi:peptidoglycan hydrolase CwlO-like protein